MTGDNAGAYDQQMFHLLRILRKAKNSFALYALTNCLNARKVLRNVRATGIVRVAVQTDAIILERENKL